MAALISSPISSSPSKWCSAPRGPLWIPHRRWAWGGLRAHVSPAGGRHTSARPNAAVQRRDPRCALPTGADRDVGGNGSSLDADLFHVEVAKDRSSSV